MLAPAAGSLLKMLQIRGNPDVDHAPLFLALMFALEVMSGGRDPAQPDRFGTAGASFRDWNQSQKREAWLQLRASRDHRNASRQSKLASGEAHAPRRAFFRVHCIAAYPMHTCQRAACAPLSLCRARPPLTRDSMA